MKIRKTNKSRFFSKKVIIGASLFLIVAASVTSFWLWKKGQADEVSRGEQAAQQAGNFVDEGAKDTEDTVTPNSVDKVIAPGGEAITDSPEKPTVTIRASGDTHIRITAAFDKPSNGTCRLVMKHAGHTPIERTSQIIVYPSYYTCNGFRVAKTDFPATGTWQVYVIHEQNGKSTESDKEMVTIE